jgi:AcrR family transcriptional regulator
VSAPLKLEERPLRSDAEANRRRILEAAAAAFAADGLETSVEAIARRACVGMGTLYRRFPTKEHLVRAILEARVAELIEIADAERGADRDPWDAFETVLTAALRLQERDRGMLQLAVRSLGAGALPANHAAFLERLAGLLSQAQRAGRVRPDIEADDLPVLLRMAAGATLPDLGGRDVPGEWPRYLGLLLDGLRAR